MAIVLHKGHPCRKKPNMYHPPCQARHEKSNDSFISNEKRIFHEDLDNDENAKPLL